MTNSVIVAMMSNGIVRYEMRLFFKRCQGEKPVSPAGAELGEVEVFKLFIGESVLTWCGLGGLLGVAF